VPLLDDLERIAAAASEHGTVTGVLAAEPASGRRLYLVAYGDEPARGWLVLDDEERPVERREVVREAASIVVVCELAAEVAGGGDLEELRAQLVQLRLTERPDGIEDAEEAALALEQAIGAPPRVASPAYLDAIGLATRELERALGSRGSPFATAMKGETGTVDAFVSEVEAGYKLPL
jgi:hypothetical protein